MPTKQSDEIIENVGTVVVRLKEIAHIPNRIIGEHLHLSTNVVQQRMSGESKWTTGELFMLADFFEVPVDLFYKDPREASVEAITRHDVQGLRFRLDGDVRARKPADQGSRSFTCTPEIAGQEPESDAA